MTMMFWKRFFSARHTSAPLQPLMYYSVIDSSNDTLIAISSYPPPVVLLAESMLDTIYVHSMPAASVAVVRTVPPRNYPEWSWNYAKREFQRTNPAIITDDLRERAVFAARKAEILSQALYAINRQRDKIYMGLMIQETIYAEKEKQARMLKEARFDAGHAGMAPYVVQYADSAGLSLEQAAEEILFQAQLDRELLEKSERVRLLLFRKLKRATTEAELDEIMRTFYRDGTV